MSRPADSQPRENLFDEALAVDPPVGDEQLSKIPAKRGVVLLRTQDGRPIVMLTAADMRSRTRTRLAEPPDEDQPSKSPDLRGITRTIHYRRCESHFETDWRFLEACAEIWPRRYPRMIGWKAPWFGQIALEDAYPYFHRTRDVGLGQVRQFGPFASGADADRFNDALIDAFDLCRSITCLRRAPDGPRCAYAEMGRCVSPADGTISMDEYRVHLQAALDFALGDRQPLRDRLTQRMQRASAELAFEQAAACKHRLQRLDAFESSAWRQVRPVEQFGYILAQAGAGVHEFRWFGAWGGRIVPLGRAAYPIQPAQTADVLQAMRTLTARPFDPPDAVGQLRMGLVVRTLFAQGARGGVVLPWSDHLDAAGLQQAVEEATDALGVRDVPSRTSDDESPDAT